jgi:hypothetical protein
MFLRRLFLAVKYNPQTNHSNFYKPSYPTVCSSYAPECILLCKLLIGHAFSPATSTYSLSVSVVVYCFKWSHWTTHIHSVGLPCIRDRPVAEASTYTTRRSQETFVHAAGSIRTRNPSKRAALGNATIGFGVLGNLVAVVSFLRDRTYNFNDHSHRAETSSFVPIHISVPKYQPVQTFECRHVFLMSSIPSRANLRGKQLVPLIQMPYICLCASILALTDGCHCVAQRRLYYSHKVCYLIPIAVWTMFSQW